MADLTITVASVRPLAGCIIRRFTAGETMTPGQPVYMSDSDTVSLCDASDVTKNFCVGIVVSNSDGAVSFASGEKVDVVLYGPVTGFATNLAANTVVYTDDDAGVLADAAGTKDTMVGIGLSTSVLLVKPQIIDFA